ncbi:hypothetical protein JCM10449v2_005138 [Rhodotorula kratochvilovae]
MTRLVVKASLSGSTFPRRTTFPDASTLERDDLAFKLARSFSLQPNSFRLAYRDDDNDLIELASTADLREALDYFATDASSSASSSSGWFGAASKPEPAACITLKLELLVEYDGPALSDAGSSIYSLGGARSRSGSSSAGSDDSRGWRAGAGGTRRARSPATSDTSSDRWILQRAFDGSRAGGDARTALGTSDSGDSAEDDDWDRRTVSSASQPFRNDERAAHPLPDAQRIPPLPDPVHDALYPNFARGHFTPANAHPYPPAAPYAYPPPPPPPPPHAFHPHPPHPPPPHLHGYPPLFPPFGSFPPFPPSPPPPAFFARFPPSSSAGSALPPLSYGGSGSGSSLSWAAGAGASPTPSQRERARDLFAASSSEGSARAGVEDDDERKSAYTVVTSSDPDGGEGGEEERAGLPRDEDEEGETEGAMEGAKGGAKEGAKEGAEKCERIPSSSSSTSPASSSHTDSHILLKIPSAASSFSSVSSARAQAAALVPTATPAASDDIADYWHWWASWYSALPHAHPHPPPPGSSWYAPAAPSPRGASPARVSLAPAPPASAPASAPPPRSALYTHPSHALYAYPNHGVACQHCNRTIAGPDGGGTRAAPGGGEVGVRWLCANCPTVPSYDLCPDCEPLSAHIHDPSHAFLRLTHPLRRPLPSVRALLPVLYLPSAAAPAPECERDLMDLRSDAGRASTDSGDGSAGSGGSARTRTCGDGSGRTYERAVGGEGVIVHERVMCDACSRQIEGTWMRCSHCPTSFDLCAPCLLSGASAQQAHNPAHVFVALKAHVNVNMLSRITRLETRRPRGLLEVDLYA